ncbi:peptidylprolyl isomerase [Candidatus Zixiibacteriota bacterium]
MFGFLRRMIVPIMLIALIGFLATIIFQWGMDITSRDQYVEANLAAVINGEEITWDVYNRFYSNMYQIEAQKVDDELPDSKIKELQTSAWNQLQQEVLLNQQVEKYDISTTDDEYYMYLRMAPPQELRSAQYFQTNGQFDPQKYINALADPNYATLWNQYEPIARNQIRQQKLYTTVVQTAHVTENEIKDAFLESEEKIKVGVVKVGQDRFFSANIKFTDEEQQEYFNNNRDNFKTEEKASLDVVAFSKEPIEEDWEYLLTRLSQIRDTINDGADFAEMAQIYSQDGSAQNGGDLNWFNQGQMVKPFDEKVFSMKKGELSEPVRTRFGYHIIKLHDTKEEYDNEQKKNVKKAHASHILLQIVASAERIDRQYIKLEELYEIAQLVGFDSAAAELELTVQNTGNYIRGQAIKYLGNDATPFTAFTFSNEIGQFSKVLETTTIMAVIRIVDKLPAGLAEYDDAKQKVFNEMKFNTIDQLCHDTSFAIYNEIQNGSSIEKAATKFGAEYQELKESNRNSYFPEVNNDPKAIAVAFTLKEVNDISEPVYYQQRGYAIFRLLSKTTPDLTEFTSKRDSIKVTLLTSKQQQVFNEWYNNLVKTSEIINNTGERFNN